MDPRRGAAAAALVLGTAMLAVSQMPHVWALRTEWRGSLPDRTYAGYPVMYADEAATYLAWIRQAREGRFFLSDRFTPEEHPRNYVNVLFSTMGAVAAVTGLSEQTVYSGARVLLGAIVLWMLWAVAGVMFERPWERLACYTTLLVAGGWEGAAGFLERNAGGPHVSSMSWWTPQISTFFSLMLFPHILASFVCLLAAVLLLARAWSAPEKARQAAVLGVAVGLVSAVLTFFHPTDSVTLLALVWVAPLLLALVERRPPWREWRVSAWATAVWLPALLYNVYIFWTNPAMRAWDLQNLMETPSPGKLVLAAGLSGALSALAVVRFRRLSRAQRIMVAWVVCVIVLVYLPLRFQRRLLGGIQFPLAVLATSTLAWITARLSPRTAAGNGWPVLALTLVLLPLQVATPYYLLDVEMTKIRRGKFPGWLPTPTVSALAYLEREAPRDAVVLASYDIGNLIPSRTGLRCFLGHYALTMGAQSKKQDLARFFGGAEADDPWRTAFLQRWGITYLLFTPHERNLGSFDPSARAWLRRVFHAGAAPGAEAEVYAVLNSRTPGT
jgi:hypothetical protein